MQLIFWAVFGGDFYPENCGIIGGIAAHACLAHNAHARARTLYLYRRQPLHAAKIFLWFFRGSFRGKFYNGLPHISALLSP